MIENTVTLSQEQLDKIKDTYFLKLGYEHLMQPMAGKVPENILIKYGEVCAKFTDLGEEVIAAQWGDNSNGQVAKSWSCDFNTGIFTIERA